MRRPLHRCIVGVVALIATVAVFAGAPSAYSAEAMRTTPSLWDPQRRPDKPDMKALRQIRFLTEDEFPPFNFAGSSGSIEGFNVDLARAICAELAVPCTIQARRWDTIVAALEADQADVIAAGLAITPEARARLLFSDPYFRLPARFAAAKDAPEQELTAASLAGKRIAVAVGSAHEAWIASYFPRSIIVARPTDAAAREALVQKEADFVFDDGVRLAFWVNGTEAKGCCRLIGGPYLESRYFGPGMAFAVRPQDVTLKRALDFALFQIWERGTWGDLVRRWFPVDPFAASTPG